MKLQLITFSANACLKYVTIEPTIAIYYIAAIAGNYVYVNLILQKSCRFNATSEPDLSTPCDDEKAGQVFLASTNSWRYSIGLILMTVFTVYATSWSDKFGRRRRPLIFIPVIGEILTSAIGCFSSYFWQWSVTPAIILESLVHGGTGGRFVVICVTYMYMSDISDEVNLTFRIGIVSALHIISTPIANVMAGYLMTWCGLFYSFLVCTILPAIALIIGVVLIEDTSIPIENKTGWRQALNPAIVCESFKITFKKRLCSKRTIIVLLFGVYTLFMFSIIGEPSVLYMYFRYRFGWNQKDYSLYVVYKLLLIFVGTIFSSVVLCRYLKLPDALVGIICCVANLIASLLYIFATTEWQLYTIPIVEMFRGCPMVLAASLQTKCMEKNETGHLMSVRGILTLLVSFSFPVYNLTYRATMDTFPSAFFFITSAAHLPTILLFGVVYYLTSRTLSAPISADATKKS